MSMRIPVRIFFQKINRLKYIAHLDTMRTFTRAFSQAELPVWYTEGFNPQIYMYFALSLSLGYEGLRESFDIYLLDKVDFAAVKERMNHYLPAELSVLFAAEPIDKATEIAWADYQLDFYYDGIAPAHIAAALKDYTQQLQWFVEKKSKRRVFKMDMKEHTKNIAVEVTTEKAVVSFRTAAGNFYNINPRLFTQGFTAFYGTAPSYVAYTRKAMLNKQEELFR